MEIAFLPNWIIKYYPGDHREQYDLNVLVSNIMIILIFIFFGSILLRLPGELPHFCLFERVFGVACPVCGMTRSLCSLSEGDLQASWQFNRSGIFLASFLIMQVLLRIVSLSGWANSQRLGLISKYAGRLLLAVILISWLYNLLTNH